MDKDLFNSYKKNIDIPKEELTLAIDQGIKRGETFRKNKKYKTTLKRSSLFATGAAALLLTSGFFFSPITNVLAQVPFIGGIYSNYQMPIGQKLASNQLITEINETVEDNGVKMSITSIFYDGSYVGLTFKATGGNLSDSIGGETSPESGYTYEMFDRKDESGWGGVMGTLTKQGNDYLGAIILENPNEHTPNSLLLPITFTHIAGVRGEWPFHLSVEKIPSKEVEINQTLHSLNKEYSLKFNKINIGKTNALLSYEILKTPGLEGEQLHLNIVDDQGEKISIHTLTESKVIFEIDSTNPTKFLLVKPTYKIGTKEIEVGTLKINLQ